MARIVPDGWASLEAGASLPHGAARREIETLRELGAALPGDCAVYHGVHWTRLEHGWSVYGEVDFIVVGPTGRVLLIEQRSGFLDETEDGLMHTSAGRPRSVRSQLVRSVEALAARFAQATHGRLRLAIDYLLYLPDYVVRNPAIAGIAPERIVDSRRRGEFARTVRAAIGVPLDATARSSRAAGVGRATAATERPAAERAPAEPHAPDAPHADDAATAGQAPLAQPADVHRFLSDTLELVPDVSALIGRADEWVTRLSGGLATWARQLEFEPFRLRVQGTAGSGKTQLALAVMRDAHTAGRRALYVCYNRPLADYVAGLAPASAMVATFHMLGDRRLKALGQTPDFREPGVFEKFEQAMLQLEPAEAERVDVLIVDEGQDFTQAWADAVLRHLAPGGRAWWLEDPMQNLYGREPVVLPAWVVLHADTNYRTPRDVLADVQTLIGAAHARSASPVVGGGIEVLTYGDPQQLLERTKRAISEALRAGFKRSEIALLTWRGRDGSQLLPLESLGPHRLRAFTGKYDLFGQPVFRDGDLLVETLYRFKGQSAPCVILTEVDFEALDERAAKRLFVGATRATIRFALVMSERAAAVCGAQRLHGEAGGR